MDLLNDIIWWLGLFYAAKLIHKVFYWYFIVDRSGNSGGNHRHVFEGLDDD